MDRGLRPTGIDHSCLPSTPVFGLDEHGPDFSAPLQSNQFLFRMVKKFNCECLGAVIGIFGPVLDT